MSQVTTGFGHEESDDIRATARTMAEEICRGFRAHDRGCRDDAEAAFTSVDTLQFQHISGEKAEMAAKAYVDALWAKDDVELQFLKGGGLDRKRLMNGDWGPVKQKFRERASIVGMDPEYAEDSTLAWKRHKVGGDYWTPIQRAQMYELRAALQEPGYPDKPKYGQSGYGPEPLRYALGIELHDMHTNHHWEQAKEVLTPYFLRVLASHTNDEN